METFQYVVGIVKKSIVQMITSEASAKKKLRGLIAVLKEFPVHDILKGGCPIVNLAIARWADASALA